MLLGSTHFFVCYLEWLDYFVDLSLLYIVRNICVCTDFSVFWTALWKINNFPQALCFNSSKCCFSLLLIVLYALELLVKWTAFVLLNLSVPHLHIRQNCEKIHLMDFQQCLRLGGHKGHENRSISFSTIETHVFTQAVLLMKVNMNARLLQNFPLDFLLFIGEFGTYINVSRKNSLSSSCFLVKYKLFLEKMNPTNTPFPLFIVKSVSSWYWVGSTILLHWKTMLSGLWLQRLRSCTVTTDGFLNMAASAFTSFVAFVLELGLLIDTVVA